MRVVALNQDAIGKKLGQKLYNSQGGLLLGEGTEIKDFHFSHIQQVGYKSIYVVDELEADTEMIGHIISSKNIVTIAGAANLTPILNISLNIVNIFTFAALLSH